MGCDGKGKRIAIVTFGCQMNIRDSEFVAGLLLKNGFILADSVNGADVVLFNSCSVRKHAEDRLFSNIAELKGLKKKRPGLIVGLIGCTAQNYKEKALERAPILDFVCGPGNEADIQGIIKDISKNRCSIIAADKVNDKRPELFPKYRAAGFKAYVSIGEGCNNFCSYCIVPYVRGKERSREAGDIVKEVKGLASRGFKEITLLGQNVNSYKGLAYSVERIAYSKKTKTIRYPRLTDGTSSVGQALNAKTSDFIRLLEQLNLIKGIERIRFMTSHPKDASEELFKAIRDLDKVCEHLHLPLQSGSDRVLGLMNRRYTNAKYLKLAESYKRLVPDGSITTDIIVGFPSEKEDDFKKTCDIMKKVDFDSAFLFKYSPRPPAKSARLKDDVPQKVKEERLKTLLGIQSGISQKRNERLLGQVVEILIDGHSPKEPSVITGRTRTNKIAVFKGNKQLAGTLVSVKIESVAPYALKGRIAR